MVIFFTCIFILITIFSLLHIGEVYKNNFFNKKERAEKMKGIEKINSMAMLIPCYNEEVVVRSAINNFAGLNYPKLEVIFINDGSTDKTFDYLKSLLELEKIDFTEDKLLIKCNKIRGVYKSNKYENMKVIDKENGGKADSLNAAINLVNEEFIVTLDADSILKENALDEINMTLQDPEVIATGGNIITSQGILNFGGDKIYYKAPRKIVESIQFIDYLKGFFITKNSYANLDALAVISGAFGVFKREVMFKVRGFTKSVGEDIDITIKFHKYAVENQKKIVFNDRAMCFTEVPNNWRDFFKQRIRWQKGFMDAFKNHHKFLLKNFFKDRLAFFMIFENIFLAYTSIFCMLIGIYYWIYDVVHHIPIGFLMYIVLFIGVVVYLFYDITIFMMAKRANIAMRKRDVAKYIILLVYEVLIFRQIMICIYLWGTIEYFFRPNSWNKVKRSGANNIIKEIATEESLRAV